MMKVKLFVPLLFVLATFFTACSKKQYAVKSIEGARIEMNSDWDNKADPGIVALVDAYKTKLNVEMNQEIGFADKTLTKGFPQSLLTNFTTDAMQDYASGSWGHIDFAVVNNGGLRATLNEGPVTVGNLYEVYPFENRLVLLELQGKAVKAFFDFIAFHGGEGLSKGIELVIQKRKIKSLKISGQTLDENKIYRIVTIDFLAEGNSGMEALTQAVEYTDLNITLRDAMIEFVKKLTTENKRIDAKTDNRIKIEE
ncbi:MAG: 5'-nucleotidase C-terminal domain-containing protein [Dysgonamonadaceae bacterium]|jgi:2',3'-cyclic-nucleotide 2'-phosphodiesterase (5'-nucleotidase family)|nr:5'-nucleotidase C-terminal domain-containing protein [Dysgonamonadaceae bacterium]